MAGSNSIGLILYKMKRVFKKNFARGLEKTALDSLDTMISELFRILNLYLQSILEFFKIHPV